MRQMSGRLARTQANSRPAHASFARRCARPHAAGQAGSSRADGCGSPLASRAPEASRLSVLTRAVGDVAEASDLVAPTDVLTEVSAFLEKDLAHLFDEQGLDKSIYDDKVKFEDPITKYDSIDGYLFNIQMLRYLFSPTFVLHNIRKKGADVLETRWTMGMTFRVLPWQPALTFTGTTEYTVDLSTGKIVGHKDTWDSIDDQAYFSVEGLADLVRQSLQLELTPSLESPEYVTLKRLRDYEIRRYSPYLVCETDQSSGEVTAGAGFNTLAAFIFGGNEGEEQMGMTTPVYTSPGGKMRFVIEGSKYSDAADVPQPKSADVSVRAEQPAICAVAKVGGLPSESDVQQCESDLRDALVRDGLQASEGYQLARYNEPFVLPPFRRNEVLIKLEGFKW